MSSLILKYRTWLKGIPPRNTKLQMPGWAGKDRCRANGAEPQPWHCMPFVEAATYGLELVYPFDAECKITNDGEKICFDGNFDDEGEGKGFFPFKQFAKGHYGFTSSLDLQPPEGYVIRLEPHPRFFTDETGTCPIMVPGHIQGEWWSKVFFVVFKAPRPGEMHVFRKHEPYGTVLLVPRKVEYDVVKMTTPEQHARQLRDGLINENTNYMLRTRWTDCNGQQFNDRYRVLASAFAKGGMEAVDALVLGKKKKGMKPRLVRRREVVQDKEEGPEISGPCSRSQDATAEAEPAANANNQSASATAGQASGNSIFVINL